MSELKVSNQEFVCFLKWCLPKLDLCWPGFRKVRNTVRKRVIRRMRELGLSSLAVYQERLDADPAEWGRLDRMCRIPISRFFRDKAVYKLLTLKVLPDCADAIQKRGGTILRILSAGCASGEEPYTIAMIWQFYLSQSYPELELQILALDIDDVMLRRAEAGCYSMGSLKDLPIELLEKGFRNVDGQYCLGDKYHGAVRFEKVDLRATVPSGQFDLIFCRNSAFTYFDNALQASVFEKLDAGLRDGGYLVIGGHETLPPQAHLYQQLQKGVLIYKKGIEAHALPFGIKFPSKDVLVLDGSHGEGGGQILRSALSLSAITGKPIQIENARSRRRIPGLAAQHLTSLRAVAALCGAEVSGDEIGSMQIDFRPQKMAQTGIYDFDVSSARQGGSAGSTLLVLQAVLFPLAFADGCSEVSLSGGTHIPWSPSFDYVKFVWLPMLEEIGISANIALAASGWYPAGGGKIRCKIKGAAHALKPVSILDRGPLEKVTGRAVAANLPAHIAERMATHACKLLAQKGIHADIDAQTMASVSSGAGIFLTARYQHAICGFSDHGKRGKPAEEVAANAIGFLLAHRDSGAALETHLADQIILPLALASAASEFSVERASQHLETNAWLIEQFGLARIEIRRRDDATAIIRVIPNGLLQ